MSDTPRTDAAAFSATTEKPSSGDFELEVVYSKFARELERELIAAAARLAEWGKTFETTNPAQAQAEHAAVLLKRQSLFNEVRALQSKVEALTAENSALKPKS